MGVVVVTSEHGPFAGVIGLARTSDVARAAGCTGVSAPQPDAVSTQAHASTRATFLLTTSPPNSRRGERTAHARCGLSLSDHPVASQHGTSPGRSFEPHRTSFRQGRRATLVTCPVPANSTQPVFGAISALRCDAA